VPDRKPGLRLRSEQLFSVGATSGAISGVIKTCSTLIYTTNAINVLNDNLKKTIKSGYCLQIATLPGRFICP